MGEKISFVNTRARLQRLSDAKLLNGWVQQLTPQNATIAIATDLPLSAGEKFHCEVQGKRLVGVFTGVLTFQKDDVFHFEFETPFRTRPGGEDVRFRVKGLSGQLFKMGVKDDEGNLPTTVDPNPAFCLIVDVSVGGIGVETEQAMKQGEIVKLGMESAFGQLECCAEVRYCRKFDERYRIGLHVEDMNRLNRTIYLRLLESLGY